MSIWTVGSLKMGQLGQNNPNTHICIFTIIFGCNLWYCYEWLSLLHVSRLVVWALGWHAQAGCLSSNPSITSNCPEKKESVSLEEQQNWVKMFGSVESVSWLKSGAEYDDVFMSYLEITPNFSDNLDWKERACCVLFHCSSCNSHFKSYRHTG
jgi:hypothetical protein